MFRISWRERVILTSYPRRDYPICQNSDGRGTGSLAECDPTRTNTHRSVGDSRRKVQARHLQIFRDWEDVGFAGGIACHQIGSSHWKRRFEGGPTIRMPAHLPQRRVKGTEGAVASDRSI